MGIHTAAVQRFYVAYFGRPADLVGFAHWKAQLGTTAATQAQLTTLAAGFIGSAEYAALYAGQSNTQIVDILYLNMFGRSAETAGLIHWAGKLTAGTETMASIALQLAFCAQGTDAIVFTNKLAAAMAFTAALDISAEIIGYSGTDVAASGRTYLKAVTDVAATLTTVEAGVSAAVVPIVDAGTAAKVVAAEVAAAKVAAAKVAAAKVAAAAAAAAAEVAAAKVAAVAAAEVAAAEVVAAKVAAVAAAKVVAAEVAAVAAAEVAAAAKVAAAANAVGLTLIAVVGAERLDGTAGRDTFLGTYAEDGSGTFNTTDVFNGNGGSDTLIITPIGVAAITPVDAYWSGITSIEKIVIATTAAGAQTITVGAAFQAAFAAAGVDLTTTSDAGAITIDMSTFTGAAKLTTTSAAGAQTIQMGSGADTVIATSDAGAITIDMSTFTGAAKLTTTSDAGAITINMSTATGAAKLTTTSAAGAQTVVTGAGNDIITLFATGAATTGSITANAGADTITLSTNFASVDTIVQNNGDSKASTANTTTGVIAAGQTITFGNGLDSIIGFAGATDVLNVGTAGAAVTGIGLNEAAFTGAKTIFLSGAYNAGTGVFTIAAEGTGADTLLLDSTSAADENIATADTWVLLVGTGSDTLLASSFI